MEQPTKNTAHPPLFWSRRDWLKAAGTISGFATSVPVMSLLTDTVNGSAAVLTDATTLTATEAIQQIRDASLRAETYVEQLLKRYRETKDLNLVTWIDESRALQSAKAVDRARGRGEKLGRLAGLPLLIKDNIDTAGFPTSAGNSALKKYFPKKNAPVMDTLFKNGAILLAKANMHELARGGTSTNPTFGYVKNPYDPTRIPGGSSGGTAAGVAARLAPAGLGTDTAGSVRIPSAFCGVAGLRPSIAGPRKRYSDAGVVPMSLYLDTIGPIARTVADVALLNSVISGQPVPAPTSLRGIKIGLPRGDFWENIDGGVSKVAEAALAKLRDAGAILVDIDMRDFHRQAVQLQGLLMRGGNLDLENFLTKNASGITFDDVVAGAMTPSTKAGLKRLRETALAHDQAEQARTVTRAKLLTQYAGIFRAAGITAIAFPTEPLPAPLIRVNGDAPGDVVQINGKDVPEGGAITRNTTMTTALGTPGLTIPAGLTAQGLPVGLELDGLPDEDDRIVGLGLAVETVLGHLPPPRLHA